MIIRLSKSEMVGSLRRETEVVVTNINIADLVMFDNRQGLVETMVDVMERTHERTVNVDSD